MKAVFENGRQFDWMLSIVALALFACVSIGINAHPIHSDTVTRPCEIRAHLEEPSLVAGQCSFFVAGGYLVFELKPEQPANTSIERLFSGAINLSQSSGSLFETDTGQIVEGDVQLADTTQEIVHMAPGDLAVWKDGYMLRVSGESSRAVDNIEIGASISPEKVADFVTKYGHLGFIHIVPRGFDHILFVVGLFLLSPRVKTLLLQITAFTVAHTFTLALGSSGFILLPGIVVETAIALSIVWIAVEGAFSLQATRLRLAVIFFFGLLHGLGFAGVLLNLVVSPTHYFSALFSFNIGVELGQLAVIGLCFVTLGWMREWPSYHRLVVLPLLCCIGLIGAYWVIERALIS
ncbi:MAG: HupE/UreJ family protein [Pseudomonadota bacterium]